MSDNDTDPNSVFTRTLLAEMEVPGQSMVQIAKKTQAKVRALAAKVDHVQVPAYYDQIVGDLCLSPEGAGAAGGNVSTLQEGGGTSVLPKPEQKLAALTPATAPLASFTRSNSGWMVNVSLPEAATQFGYRVGEAGEFTDPDFIDALDQRTGARMPKTYFEMPPDQGKTTIYVTWRDKRGEEADVFPINFRSECRAWRRREGDARAVLDELDRVSRVPGDEGLFQPAHHLSLRDQGGALRL